MAQFTADIAGMLEILAIAAGLVLLHRAGKEAPARLFKAAGWVLLRRSPRMTRSRSGEVTHPSIAIRKSVAAAVRLARESPGRLLPPARKEAAVRRVAPAVGLLYSTLVLWFAEGVHATSIAAPPVRPWYRHKRGLAFSDVLRTAQRVLQHVDVLDPECHSGNLRQPTRPARQPHDYVDRIAA